MQKKMSSKRKQQPNEAGAKTTRTVGKKTGPAVNR